MAKHAIRPYREPVEAAWQLPNPPWYKVNIDRVVFEQQKEAGVGIVIRDLHGVVMAALSKKLKAPLGALEVEAKAMVKAVTFAWDLGIRDCIFESDALTIVNAMLRLTDPPSSTANNIAGSLSHLYKFCAVQFNHVPRSGNKVAHTLAQFARGSSVMHAWIEETPSCIEKLCPKMYYF